MSELPYLLTAAPSGCTRGVASLLGADSIMSTPLTAKLAGVPGLDIAGIVNRGLEKNENGNPSVKAALGIGGTASRVMLRNLADQANSIDPNAVVGAQGENNPTAARARRSRKTRKSWRGRRACCSYSSKILRNDQ